MDPTSSDGQRNSAVGAGTWAGRGRLHLLLLKVQLGSWEAWDSFVVRTLGEECRSSLSSSIGGCYLVRGSGNHGVSISAQTFLDLLQSITIITTTDYCHSLLLFSAVHS